MLTITISADLRIIATKHAWETQQYESFSTGTDKWRFVAHHATIINALLYVRQTLIKRSKAKELVSAQADVDNLLMNVMTSQNRFIKRLISLNGNEKIDKLDIRNECEKIKV
jgi:hypothetical protein|tara:strand:- start:93 stop:428 length:336 start_codon:yes stop_codon:yes gene_type:complete